MLTQLLTTTLLLTLASAQNKPTPSQPLNPAFSGAQSSFQGANPQLLPPTQNQGNPSAIVPSTYLPVIIPTGTSLAAAVITAAADGNQLIMAVQCRDPACSDDPAATASFSLDTIAGTGSYTWAWTAKNNQLNSTSYGCPLTTDLSKNVPCTVAFPSGLTATAEQYSNYPMATLVAPFPSGAAQVVGITKGAEMLPPNSLICGSTQCAASQIVTGENGQPTTDGRMGGSGGVATAPSESLTSATPSPGAAGKMVAQAGRALVAVAAVGVVAL